MLARRLPLSALPASLGGACENSIQRSGECLLVFGPVCGRSAGLDAGGPKLIHEVAHGEALADVRSGVLRAPGVDRVDASLDEASGERDVGGNGHFARPSVLGDMVVRHVGSSGDPEACHERIVGGRVQALVRHHHGLHLEPQRRSCHDCLHVDGCGIGIDPDLHFWA